MVCLSILTCSKFELDVSKLFDLSKLNIFKLNDFEPNKPVLINRYNNMGWYAFMIHKYSTLRMMILASLPCVASSAGLAATQTSIANVQPLAAPIAATQDAPSAITSNTAQPVTEQPVLDIANTDAVEIELVETAAQTETVAKEVTIESAASAANISIDSQTLMLSLVGVFINGQERDNVEILYNPSADSVGNPNGHYYLSVTDLVRLTAVSMTEDQSGGYSVSTPIGNTSLSAAQVQSYQEQPYIALSHLKKLGISAEYNQSDLAVTLNMGWRPLQATALTEDNVDKSIPIDYRPDRAGLLGLSFNSSLTASENYVTQNNNQTDNQTATNRQIYADLGAFGYGLGGVWGVKAVGYDSSSSDNNTSNRDNDKKPPSNDKSFVNNAFGGLTYLPSDWDDWALDNLYWAKSGEHLATRLGISEPNSLGQGVNTSGSEFTGALVAYSNRKIDRHLSYFDEDSRSLLQNTSQDYQNLIGIGEAGGVAELRVNGRGIARVQIALDGRYEFLNLDVSQLALTETLVEIAIYAYPLARQPLEVRLINLGKRRTNVATGEILVEAGIGRSGNAFDNDSRYNDNSHTAAHLYAEYGINNRLAVRGGVNNSTQNLRDDDDSLSWHTGVNFTPSVYTNADLSYAHTPIQDLWQAQLDYERKKLWASYQYQARNYDESIINTGIIDPELTRQLSEQRHQLLLSYRPNDRTNINFNQYYDDLVNQDADFDSYHAYTSINHRFNEAFNASANWDTRDNRYGYRLLWQDINRNYNRLDTDSSRYNFRGRNTVGLSGDSDSDTLSLRHQFNDRISVGQAFSRLHDKSDWLYQGDISYRFDRSILTDDGTMSTRATDSLINVGYSFYDNQIGWQADWQLTHRNGINFGLGYKHRYVDTVSSNSYDDLILGDSLVGVGSQPAWTQNNYLYAKLSFDMFKAPKKGLKFGNYPRQNAGSVVVDINHPTNAPINHETMRFELDKQKVQASLLAAQANHSQYLISNIKAGDYTLTMDAENLPLEYSTSELPTPRIRVSNYAPTSVPLQLQNTYGVSGKLADAIEGVEIDIYQNDVLIQTITTGSYGYFQAFGLQPNTYTLKAEGYATQSVDISNNFVMQLSLLPLASIVSP